MMVRTTGVTRTVIYILLMVTLLAFTTVLVHSEPVDAGLSDAEPPAQYETHSTAYTLSEQELGSPLLVRKEGGGDRDYIKIPFLDTDDLVSVSIDQMNTSNQVEYWVEDPNHFPIYHYQYNGLPEPPQFSFNFAAVVSGPYFFYHGQGFGTTVISVNFSVQPGSSMGDGNDQPDDAVEVNRTMVENGTFGQPDDPADFFRLELDPSPAIKTFLSIYVSTGVGTEAQWEMYNSTGIQRQGLTYSGDVLAIGYEGETFDERMEERGTLYLRLWCWRGGGDYKLYINIETYPEDDDDTMEGAGDLVDGQTVNGTLHTRFDEADHYRIDMDGGDILLLTMDVEEDLDLFVVHSDGYQVASSRNWDDESEHISYAVPPDCGGTYIVRVVMSSELDPLPFREVMYRLHVVTNLPPGLDPDYALTYRSWPVLEDWVDEGILLTNLFFDPEGGPLTFSVVPGHNETYLEATVTGAMRLRLEPAENVSGFIEEVTVEAVDDGGKRTRFTISVAVNAVNDAPVVGNPVSGPPPGVLELDEDDRGGPWDILFWFWDSDDAMSEMRFSFETDPHLDAWMDDLDRLVLESTVADWNGRTNLTVRVRDPGDLGALLRVPVVVRPVNDPPRRTVDEITITVEGGVLASLSVDGLFLDVDGDVLSYTATSGVALVFMVVGPLVNVDGLLPYQNGTVLISVTATDPHGISSNPLNITLKVGDLEDPHTILPKETEYTLLWGRGMFFTDFTLVDLDTGYGEYEVVLSTGNWSDRYHLYRFSGLTWDGRCPYWAPERGCPVGDSVVTMVISDQWYSASVSWTVHVRETNIPPEVISVGPDRPGPYHVGDIVTFHPDVVDAEGDPLRYLWFFDDGDQGDDQNYSVRLLSRGKHQVSLTVLDGFDSTEVQYDLYVLPEGQGPGPPVGLFLAILVGSATAVGMVLYKTSRHRRPA